MINYRNSYLIAKEINRKSITAPSIRKVQRWITRRGFIYKSHVENGLLIDVSKKVPFYSTILLSIILRSFCLICIVALN